MAQPTATARDFSALLVKSKLLPADEADAAYRRWKDEARPAADDADAFRRHLVSRRLLTEYQSVMLLRGHSDGFLLGGYTILDRVGKGQMGGVYRARHDLGQTVALKILPASRAKDPHVLGRFQREARLLLQLDHPNVVRGFQVGEAGGRHYFVMECLDGETLDEVLARRRRLPPAEAARLVFQALQGLQHLHERRMVHRDLKPANLMVTPVSPAGKPDTTWGATLKILDVGLGRELFAEGTPQGKIETQLTAEGSVLGTPDYLAPEQAKDARTSDVRADVYSLGCVFYHLLVGRPPFPDTNIMTQMVRHATEPPPPLAAHLSDVPPGLQAVLDTMLAKDPGKRYQTPAGAAEAVRPFLSATQGSTPAAASLVPAYREWLAAESGLGPAPDLPPKKETAAVPPPPRPVPPPPPPPPPPPAAPWYGAPGYPQPGMPNPYGPYPVPAAPPPAGDDVEVELMAPPPPPPPAAPVVVRVPDDRPLWELDRRDFIMLGAGGSGVLFAVGLGYGLARLVRRKTNPDPIPPDDATPEK